MIFQQYLRAHLGGHGVAYQLLPHLNQHLQLLRLQHLTLELQIRRPLVRSAFDQQTLFVKMIQMPLRYLTSSEF